MLNLEKQDASIYVYVIPPENQKLLQNNASYLFLRKTFSLMLYPLSMCIEIYIMCVCVSVCVLYHMRFY
jgi:hypothetical protein